jgi:hypothetical protein
LQDVERLAEGLTGGWVVAIRGGPLAAGRGYFVVVLVAIATVRATTAVFIEGQAALLAAGVSVADLFRNVSDKQNHACNTGVERQENVLVLTHLVLHFSRRIPVA